MSRRIPFGQLALRVGAHSRGLHWTTSSPVKVAILDSGIEIRTEEPTKRSVLPHLWLRDNCRCSKCVNQDTLQRNFNTFDIPKSIKPFRALAEKPGLLVTWFDDNHRSLYPWDFIQNYQRNDHWPAEPIQYMTWGSHIADKVPSLPYGEVMDTQSEKGVAKLTAQIRRWGFSFVENTPFDDAHSTEKLLERIAFIRVTHYGGFYDFIPDLAMADTAYTNLALAPHTDTTYFTDPAGLQAFHLLSHEAPPPGASEESTSGDGSLGGQSLLVDGFLAAKLLKKQDPEAYDILSRVKLPWHASGNKGITLSPDKRYPVLELDSQTGKLHRIRWNNDDRGVVPFDDGIDPIQWYDAARKWDAILRRPDVQFWTQLRPGRTLVFDNWRVLHGRSAFVGRRRMCGGYINRDDFISRWRNTNYHRDACLKLVVG